jgi:putative CocE/NonD family hydrolase
MNTRSEESRYEVVAERGVMVPMRDGVRLVTDLYFPALDGKRVEGRFPVILLRTPYPRALGSMRATNLVPYGYVVVLQSVRGRYGSEGRWRLLRDDGNDGYDVATWLGEQSWFSGKIGTVGTSYPGGTQHALAIARAPFLAAMVPIDALSNAGRYGFRHHGAFELRFFNWVMTFGNPWLPGPPPPGVSSDDAFWPTTDPDVRAELEKLPAQIPSLVRSLPLRPGTTALRLLPDYENFLVEAMSHGDNDSFWTDMGASVVDHVDEYADVPVLHVTGWYDSWGASVANLSYVALSKEKRSPQRLLLGPWVHGGQMQSFAGEAEFGAASAIDLVALHRRWFDRWLKGIANGVEHDAPVRLFVMGGGDGHKTAEGRIFVGGYWRDETAWPLARAVPTRYYLHGAGALTIDAPRETAQPSRYRYDPRDPVPTLGGNLSSQGALAQNGAFDQRCRPTFWLCKDDQPLASRSDVLVFDTKPLTEELEVTGSIVAHFYISSSAPDTDFTVKLIDVWPPNADFPEGVALNVADSIVRTRYRNSFETAELMQPGNIYEIEIETYPTSLVFGKGHRIRIDVSSSNFPRFDPNPNTGEPLNAHTHIKVAENVVYHDREHASHVVLPVVPR